MPRWYKRRGGYIPRTPWINKPVRRGPLRPISPMQPPLRRPTPTPYPISIPVGRGRGVSVEKQPKPETQPTTGPQASPKTETDMRTKYRRRAIPRVRVRIKTPWGNILNRRRKKSSATRIKPMGSGTTFSAYKERSKYRSFRKRVAVLSPRQTSMITSGARTEWSYSQQGRANFTVASKPAILDLCNNISGYNDSTRFFLKDGSDEFFLSNQSNANCYIKIYHYWVRRDTDTNVSALMDRAFADIAGGSGTTPTTDSYGTTPQMAFPTIAPFYRLARTYYIELGAGRSHRHVCKYSWNKEWNQEIYAEGLGSTTAGTQSKLAGWTRVIFMLMHGEPVNDVTTKTTVVPSSGAVDIVRRTQLNYYYGNPTNPLLEYGTSFVTTGVTENIMEADTDAPSAVEKA